MHRCHLASKAILLATLFLPACGLLPEPNLTPTPSPILVLPTVALPKEIKASATSFQQSVSTPEQSTPLTLSSSPSPQSHTANDTPSFTATPAFSQSPQGKIVFVCQVFRDGDRDQICLINADGSGQRRLTQNDGGDYNYPSFSPDGKSILYAGKEGGDFDLFEIDLSGHVHQLTSSGESEYAPHVSPDDKYIVYTSRDATGQSIWVANRDGSSPRKIFGLPQGNGWDPVWSPDGARILFASDRASGIQLFLINPDGSDLRQLTEIDGLRGRSDWSPDGETLATYAGPSWLREIILLDLQGSILNQLTQGGNNLAPSFSPDGGWIAFTSYQDRYQDDNGCEIYTMRVDGSQVIRLTDNDYCDWQPRWGR